MGLLQRFESRLEQAVAGAFAKAFRSAVQPVELAAALQREVDNSAQILSRDRRLVPNSFTVALSPVDHDRLQPYAGTLTDELTELLHEHAEDQRYVLAGPVAIVLERAEDLVTGRFRVRSHASAEVVPRSREPLRDPGRGVATTTVALEINGDRHLLHPPGAVVGRGADADLRINDPGVSRRHAEFTVSGERVSVTDLGSTNGTLVDGRRVTESALGDGSVVRVGNTDILLRLDIAAAGRDGVSR